MLVSAIEQCKSAVSVYIYVPSLLSLPPSHSPSQPLHHQSTGPSACVTEQRPASYFTRGSSPGSSVVKNPLASSGDARDTGSIPGSGRSPRVVNGKLLQFSCLENSMDRGAWQATAQKVEKCRTRLSGCVHTRAVYVCQGCCLNHLILYSKSGAQGRSTQSPITTVLREDLHSHRSLQSPSTWEYGKRRNSSE